MQKDSIKGGVQVCAGGYLAYKGLEYGLPRAVGIRTEYHITSKENAELIRKADNYLEPRCGGKRGWSEKVKSKSCIKNSTGYIHITGLHKDSMLLTEFTKSVPTVREVIRRGQLLLYNTVANLQNPEKLYRSSRGEVIMHMAKSLFCWDKTKTFYIPGIDSYFNEKFIPDIDDVALKSSERLKCYDNRFSAMLTGLKDFGLKGIVENKTRAVAGIALVLATGGIATKLIKKGLNNIRQGKE